MAKSNYILLGPPGAGKGTQGPLLAKHAEIPHISTGDMLRDAMRAGSELGKQVKEVVDSGQLVSDELMVGLIESRINQADCEKGFILDGFPRTIPQAKSLDALLAKSNEGVTHAILFDIELETLLARLEKRRVKEGRVDDSIDTQKERLKVYKTNTAPLIEYYKNNGKLLPIESEGTVEEVTANLLEGLGR